MKSIIEQAFRQYVSGVVNLNEKGEVKAKDNVFIVFPNNSLEYVLVKKYFDNGKKYWEREYRNGQQHGKDLGWDNNGQKWWKEEYQNGQLHGKSLCWYGNGQKHLEMEYRNGKQHGKYLSWYSDGKKRREKEYRNGKLVYEKSY